jgi:hypothetical protein
VTTNLCALTNQCLCHLNDTVESYSGHIIHIVFYARLNGDSGSIKVLRSLYILKLVRPPN